MNYAGIGARSLKPEQRPIVTKVATYLAKLGYTVHSGAAEQIIDALRVAK